MKRFLSLILCVLMVVAIVPMGLFIATAADGDEPVAKLVYSNPFETADDLAQADAQASASLANSRAEDGSGKELFLTAGAGYWQKSIDISETEGKVHITATLGFGSDTGSSGGTFFYLNDVAIVKVSNKSKAQRAYVVNGSNLSNLTGKTMTLEATVYTEATSTYAVGDVYAVLTCGSSTSTGVVNILGEGQTEVGDSLTLKFGIVTKVKAYVDDVNVYIYKSLPKYDVTAIANGDTIESVQVAEGNPYTLPEAPERYGYDFLGWTDGETTYATGDKVTITAAKTFNAVYQIQEGMSVVNVTIVSDGYTLGVEPIVTGDQFVLPGTPDKEGYNFKGWSDGTNTYAAGEKVTINEDTTFTAVFAIKVFFNVTVKSEGETVDTAVIEEGYTYTLPDATSKEGYNFMGWSDGVNSYAPGAKATIIAETTFEAVFAEKVFVLVSSMSDDETVDAQMVETGMTYTLPAATYKEGFKFAYWYDGTAYYTPGAKVMIVGPTTFTAVYADLGEGKVLYQNSFTTTDDLNDATQRGAGVSIDYGRLAIGGGTTSWWRKKIYLDNAAGDLQITFKFYPNLMSTYDIFAINKTTVLSSFYDWDGSSAGWPFSHWIHRGLRFGDNSAAEADVPYNDCYAGYNLLENEATATITVDIQTGDTVVTVEYDCGENGVYSFTSPTLNVGAIDTESFEITLGMQADGTRFRMDDLVVKQADGQAFASSDIVDREVFAYFYDNFDTGIKGDSALLSGGGGTEVNLNGNMVNTGCEYATVVKYPTAYPGSTAVLSFDFMIPDLPENPAHNDQITIVTCTSSKQNHVTVKYDETLGKWIAGKCTNDLVMSSYVEVEEGKWYHAVIMFGKGTYINGQYAGMSSAVNRDNGKSIFRFTNGSYQDSRTNVAGYYIDNVYSANGCFDNDVVRVTGYQKSGVVDGTYNIRFVCALPTLFEKQTKVGFDITSPSQSKSWNFETTKVYNSLSANYGTDTITAKSLDAQALVAVAVKGIPEELANIDLNITPYVVINGKKVYGSTVYMNPEGTNVDFSGICDINVVDPEQTPIVSDPNGDLAGKKVVILMGQSNMAGRGDVSTVEKIDDDRLWMWRDGQIIKLEEPAFTDKNNAGTSPGIAFAKAYAETYDEEVIVIPTAVGGTAISYWAPGAYAFSKTVDAARMCIERGAEVVAVLWHQGESDANKAIVRRYAYRYKEFIQQFYYSLNLDWDTVPFIAGEMFTNHPDAVYGDPVGKLYYHSNALNINEQIYLFTYSKTADNHPMKKKGVPASMRVGYEDVPTLHGIVNGEYLRNIDDYTHLDAPSTRVFGYRYFNVFQDLVQGDVDGDGNIDYYDFADPLDLPEDQRTIENVGAILDSYLITAE